MRKIFTAFAALAVFAAIAHAQPGDSLQKVSPGLAKFVPASPIPNGFIADVANVLSRPSHDSLDAIIRTSQSEGTGDIGVAILPSIGENAIEDIALAIYRTWRIGRIAKIGDAQRNLGVLILLVPKELTPNKKGYCRIQTGRGAEGAVTDATAGDICRNLIQPQMIKRDYSAAAMVGITAITAKVRGDMAPTAAGLASGIPDDSVVVAKPRNDPEMVADDLEVFKYVGKVFAWIFAALFGIIYAMRWKRHHRRKCPKCGKKMKRLSEKADDAYLNEGQLLEENLNSIDYDVWECSCGERLILPWVKFYRDFKECEKCHFRTVKTTQKVFHAATYSHTGSAENRYKCEKCGNTSKEFVTLPILTTSSSSSDSSSGSSSSSSSDSFGGSGDSGGGGGGSSY